MANSFWEHTSELAFGQVVSADDLNNKLYGIEAGFDKIEQDYASTPRLPADFTGNPVLPDGLTLESALLWFDENGDLGVYPFGLIQDQLNTMETSVANIASSEANITGLVTDAETARDQAQTHATNAQTARTNAEAAQTNAQTAEANALAHSNTAQTQANFATTEADRARTEADRAETAKTDLETARDQAQTAAANALTSETNAKTSENNATAAAASVAADASAAQTARDQAQTARDQAQTAASNSQDSADNAAASATAAQSSATASQNSATTASGHATQADNARTLAETARNAAQGYRDEAQTHANNAQATLTQINTAKSEVDASVDDFKGYYYGADTANPATDPLGNAPDIGDTYYNSVVKEVRAYNGSTWEPLSSGGGGGGGPVLPAFEYNAPSNDVVITEDGKIYDPLVLWGNFDKKDQAITAAGVTDGASLDDDGTLKTLDLSLSNTWQYRVRAQSGSTLLAVLNNALTDPADAGSAQVTQVSVNADLSVTGTLLVNGQAPTTSSDVDSQITTALAGRGELFAANNLSDVANSATALSNIGGVNSTQVDNQIDAKLPNEAVVINSGQLLSGIQKQQARTNIDAVSATDVDGQITTALTGRGELFAANNLSDVADAPTALANIGGVDSAEVDSRIQAVVGAAPAALDTLEELATALQDEQNAVAANTVALSNRVRVDAAQAFDATQQQQGRDNIGAIAANDIGNPETNFVTVFEAALA